MPKNSKCKLIVFAGFLSCWGFDGMHEGLFLGAAGGLSILSSRYYSPDFTYSWQPTEFGVVGGLEVGYGITPLTLISSRWRINYIGHSGITGWINRYNSRGAIELNRFISDHSPIQAGLGLGYTTFYTWITSEKETGYQGTGPTGFGIGPCAVANLAYEASRRIGMRFDMSVGTIDFSYRSIDGTEVETALLLITSELTIQFRIY